MNHSHEKNTQGEFIIHLKIVKIAPQIPKILCNINSQPITMNL